MGTHKITEKIVNSRQTCVGSFPFEYQDKNGDDEGEESVKMTPFWRPGKRKKKSDECSGQSKPASTSAS